MDTVNNSNDKLKYYKYKTRVKLWESNFMEKYGRKPNKNDIKDADVSTREAYKMYWHLKNIALEDTLKNSTFCNKSEDESNILLKYNVSHTDMPCTSKDFINEKLISQLESSHLLNESNINLYYIEKLPNTEENKINSEDTWGKHLNINQNLEKKCSRNIGKSSFQLSQKMFNNSNVSKRNPKKPYFKLKNEILLKDKDIEASKSITLNDTNKVNPSFSCIPEITYTVKEIPSQPLNITQYFFEDSRSTNRKLNKKWINRCIDDYSEINEQNNLSEISNLNEFNENIKKKSLLSESLSDNEDYILNSDSEEEHKNKRIRNSKKVIDNECYKVKKKLCTNDGYKFSINYVNPNFSIKKLDFQETDNIYKESKVNLLNKSGELLHINKEFISNNLIVQNKHIMSKRKESENEEKNQAIKSLPFFQVECLDLEPRLSLDTKTSENLINDFSRVLESTSNNTQIKSLHKSTPDKEKLEEKATTRKLNENFVRINLKKKVFVKNKKSFNFSKFKKNQWKQRKKELASSQSNLDLADFIDQNQLKCCKCEEFGHLANKCKNSEDDGLLPADLEISEYPTLQEIEEIVKLKKKETEPDFSINKNFLRIKAIDREKPLIASNSLAEIVKSNAKKCINAMSDNMVNKLGSCLQTSPLYNLDNEAFKDTPLEVLAALKMFGYNEFRSGQEKAIMRILSGLSTLVTLPTGSGKSLCYQLPAYLYSKKEKCLTLVISPLVSLMDDQVSKIPNFLSAASLHTNQNSKLQEKILKKLKDGKLDILLVSPETIVAGDKSVIFKNIFYELPPIAFVCIDEVHCISQWSHNFRPAYLLICRVLKEKLGITRIIGLTATASKAAILNIINFLNIKDGMKGVIREKPLPPNLNLTVSQDINKDEALIQLLKSKQFIEIESIIIYCTRRDECARVAELIRVNLQDNTSKNKMQQQKRVYISPVAEAYHAGLSAHRRKLVQTAFMKSETRIIVATVAFGMGINKSNIRSVIHFNMPASFENYVQEIGRAGRDGLPAHCHLFLNPQGYSDECELRRHINANGIDRYTIRRLLQKVFISCSCNTIEKSSKRCAGHEVAFSIDETTKFLDITEETIATLLCYLELHPKHFVKVLPPVYINAKVISMKGFNFLKMIAQNSPPLSMALALAVKNKTYEEDQHVLEFPVVDVAAAIGWDSGLVKSHLKNLEWSKVEENTMRSGLLVSFNTLGFHVKAPGDLSTEELDEALNVLYQRTQDQTILSFRQLKFISSTLKQFCFPSVKECTYFNNGTYSKSEELKSIIRTYFEVDDPLATVDFPLHEVKLQNEVQITADIRTLISNFRNNNFTGRSIARIFHGISSPNYPALIWSKCGFWRAHLSEDFNAICRLATKEILKIK